MKKRPQEIIFCGLLVYECKSVILVDTLIISMAYNFK